MEVSVENTSTLGRRIKVSVPDATIKELVKTKMAKLAREVRLKGFRPGKVPVHVLQQKFGSSVRSEVIKEQIEQSFRQVFQKDELQPAGMPKIEEIQDDADRDLEFVATFEVFPQITLADFSQANIEKRVVEITDADVEKMVVKLSNQLANWNSVDRKIKQDDKLVVDFDRVVKEKNVQPENQKNVEMIVGAEGVLPGLSEALYGKSKGEVVNAALRYPDDWADKDVAGKEVELTVTVHDILERSPLTEDELIEKLGVEGQDKALLREKVRERMQEELDSVLKDEVKESVLEKLLEFNPIELPKALIEQEKEAIRREMTRGKNVQLPNGALDSEEMETSAKRRVELGLLLNEVIKANNLKSDGQRVRNAIEKMAMRFPNSKQIVEAYYRNNELLNGIERMVLLEQAVETLLAQTTVHEKKATFENIMNESEGTAEA